MDAFSSKLKPWRIPAALTDPRLFQIFSLGILLAAGAYFRDFSLRSEQVVLTFAAGLLAQTACWTLTPSKPRTLRSAIITCLALSLLLRADNMLAHPIAAAAAIGSKLLFRFRDKHLFNPATFGVIFAIVLLPGTWVSPGQWGQDFAIAGWLMMLGMLVTNRARRGDISWAFLAFYLGALALRIECLGNRFAVWTHQLESGALLLFAFFMISDPMTGPNHRRGRIAHAALVAAIAYAWQVRLYRTNGLIWALFIAAPCVPLWDAIWPARKFEWTQKEFVMNRLHRIPIFVPFWSALTIVALILGAPHDARAFCGFYVGKADEPLVNHASQVVIAHHDDKTVISLMNDYQGEPSEFALVVPVPVVLQKGQVHIGDRELFQKIDAYSSPRLVEYYDPDPCEIMRPMAMGAAMAQRADAPSAPPGQAEAKTLGVTVEAEYTVGEYDIVILSAKESLGLQTWLQLSGYKIPLGADRALEPYIRSDMKFFVAKVNLAEHNRTGLTYLRPLQFAFDSPKFMLPIRLGMINSQGPQDLVVYMLTENGRVETTNYRTLKLPTGVDIPEYVRGEFGDFYKAMFDEQVKRNDMRAVFTEYVWNMGWCDPCAGPPLSREELKSLGVFWLDDQPGGAVPMYRRPGGFMPYPQPMGGAMPVMLTRLHVRYSAETFPEDLIFQETQDQENFQARYVMHRPWDGSPNTCEAAKNYFDELIKRKAREAETLADLTGWNLGEVIKKAGLPPDSQPKPWWQGIWGS